MKKQSDNRTVELDSELKNLSCLFEITKHLASSHNLQNSLERIMEILAREKGMDSGTITIINPTTGELEIEVAHGITAEARRRGRYTVGEGITGKVVVTGEPILVPQIGEEPMFLNRTRTRGDEKKKKNSFLCVPIKAEKKCIGALSIDREYKENFGIESENDLRFLTVVSSLVAQSVQRIRIVNEEQEILRQENSQLRRELASKNRIEDIIGNSSRMAEVFDMVHRVADSNATVLLRGESGTGKTMVAKALHANSKRKKGPFIVVNCAAIPESLMESELFGHEKGAFTGAISRKKGRFEQADGGTLFLDEISETSPAVQVKLLNVIQERTFQRLGGSETLKVDIRLVAATNRDLEKAVQENSFREDLYYRLNVVELKITALCERRDDILPLARHFLDRFSGRAQTLSPTAERALLDHPWPGTARELENRIQRATVVSSRPEVDFEDLGFDSGQYAPLPKGHDEERQRVIDALDRSHGVVAHAAEFLEISRQALYRKMSKLGIEVERKARPERQQR